MPKDFRFGEKGTTGVGLVDIDLPFQCRGRASDRLYLWRSPTVKEWVDVRDVPGLMQDIGEEHLTGDYVDDLKKRKATKSKGNGRKKKQKQEKESVEALPEQQADAETEKKEEVEVKDA